MKEILQRTAAPIASLLIIMLGISYFNTYMSVRISVDGWNNFMTGAVYSAYYGGMMIGALYMEKLIKHTGHIRAFSIFASIAACSIIFQSFTGSPIIWIFFRFITGLSCAGLFICIESWLLLLSSVEARGAVLSIYMVALYSAQAMSQFILNFFDISGQLAFSFTVLFCCFSILPVCFMRAAAPSMSESEHVNIFYVLRKIPLGFLGNLMSGLILSSFYALAPVYAKESGYSIWQISVIMAITITGGMALQWPIGIFSDIVARRKVIITIALTLMVISGILFFVQTPPFPILLFLLFFYGGFAFTLYPISITYCCDFFSSAGITAVTCAALIIYGIGSVSGPLLSPIVMELTRPSGLFLYSGVLSFILAAFAIWRNYKLPSQSKATKEHFQPMPNTTPIISELDPRSDD